MATTYNNPWGSTASSGGGSGLGTAAGLASMAIPGAGWIGPALTIGSQLFSALSGNSAKKKQEQLQRDQLQLQRDQMAQQQGQFDTSNALAASQQDPLAQQKSRQKNALVAALMGGGGNITPSASLLASAQPFFTNDARANAEGSWADLMAKLTGGKYVGGMPQGVGYTTPAVTPVTPTTPDGAQPRYPGLQEFLSRRGGLI